MVGDFDLHRGAHTHVGQTQTLGKLKGKQINFKKIKIK